MGVRFRSVGMGGGWVGGSVCVCVYVCVWKAG